MNKKTIEKIIIIAVILLGLISYLLYAIPRGCGILSTFNPEMHEYCECEPGKYYNIGYNCFKCEHICAVIKNATQNTFNSVE